MAITFNCPCGKSLSVPDHVAGRKARCPSCSAVLIVPDADEPLSASTPPAPMEYTPEPAPAPPPARVPAPRQRATPVVPPPRLAPSSPRGPSNLGRYVYAAFLLALIPLALTIGKAPTDLMDRVAKTVNAHPELKEPGSDLVKLKGKTQITFDDLLMAMPNHQLDGAMLARDSYAHWAFAVLAAAAYLAILMVMFPRGEAVPRSLFLATLFTATFGVFLLLAFQWFADLDLPSMTLPAKLWIILLIVKFIGFSYVCASNPSNGLILSFLGFTCGVGLCEELTKAIPVLVRSKSIPGQDDLSWRGSCLWGMASGLGFGVAEGVLYSSRYYNGVESGLIYLVRFVSCVALHAVWAGIAGILIYKFRERLRETQTAWSYMGMVVLILALPMVLHGLYDTLLKKDHGGYAFVTALVSFGVLAWFIESMRKAEPDGEESLGLAPA